MLNFSNLKNVFSNIRNRLLAFSFFLGLILIRTGLKYGVGIGRTIYLILGPVLLMPLILFLIRAYFIENKQTKQLEKELAAFKATADQVTVNLRDVKIKSTKWTETKVLDHSTFGGMNQAFGEGGRNLKQVEQHLNIVQLLIPYKQEEISYEIKSSKDLATLTMLLEMKESTILYIDPKDTSKNYLDVAFLDS